MTMALPIAVSPVPAPGLPAAFRPVALEWLGAGLQDLLSQMAASPAGGEAGAVSPPALQRLVAVLGFLGLSGERTVVQALGDAWQAPDLTPALREQACADLGAHLRTLTSDPWPTAPVATALVLYPLYRVLRTIVGAAWAPPLALWPAGLALPSPASSDALLPVVPLTLLAPDEALHACDEAVLRWVRDADRQAAQRLSQACAQSAAGTRVPEYQALWNAAAHWCRLLSQGDWPPGPLSTRMVSRLRTLWQAEAQGRPLPSEGLLQELQCLCALVPHLLAGASVWPACLPKALDAPWPGPQPLPSVWHAWDQALAQAEAAWAFWRECQGPSAPPLALALEALAPALAAGPSVLAPLVDALQALGRHTPEEHDLGAPAWGRALAGLLQGLRRLALRPACLAQTHPEDLQPLVAWVRTTLLAPEPPTVDMAPPWPTSWVQVLVAERNHQASQALQAAVQEVWGLLLLDLEGQPPASAHSDPAVLLARLRGALPWRGRAAAVPALDVLTQALHDLTQAAPEHQPLCRVRLADAVARCEAALAGRDQPLASAPPAPASAENPDLQSPRSPPVDLRADDPAIPPLAAIGESPDEPPWSDEDALDPDLFPLFAAEAETLLPRLAAALRAWLEPATPPPPDKDTLAKARREALQVLHTLKGSARMAGALRLGERAHRLESAMGGHPMSPSPSAAAALLAALDRLQVHAEGLCAPDTQAPQPPISPSPAKVAAPCGSEVDLVPPSGLGMLGMPAAPSQMALRVPAAQLDALLDSSTEVLLEQAQLAGHLAQLRAVVHSLRSSDQVRTPDTADAKAYPADDGQPTAPWTILAAQVRDAQAALDRQARQLRQWQQTLLQWRMVPFARVAERLHAVVRQAAAATGKSAALMLEGDAVALDQGVLERLVPVCEHLLRNAVAHGLEAPEIRQAAGKSAQGKITLALQPEGTEVALVVRDDGAGVDRERVCARAQALGHPLPSGATEAQWLDCLFLPGFSTADAVSAWAGRGMGLDAVQAEVQALGGQIAVETVLGEGTAFTLRVPLTTAITPVVLVQVGARVLGVPAARVERVLRPPRSVLVQARKAAQISLEGEAPLLPFARAAEALCIAADATTDALGWKPVLLCRSGAHRLAWEVDAVLGRQALVTKPLAPPLDQVPGLVGVSVRSTGAPVLLYDPVRLGVAPSAAPALAAQAAESHIDLTAAASLVLVVDDSPTVRAHLQRWLLAEGYRVMLADDGQAALDQLKAPATERPAVVLTDLDMPRLDGLGLARALHADPALRDLPLLVLTARADEATFAQARALGVQHCLVKPFDPPELRVWLRRCARMGAAFDPSA